MDPPTIDTIVEGAKIGGIILGSSVAFLGLYFGALAGIMRIAERKYAVSQARIQYEERISRENNDLGRNYSNFK